MGATYRAEGRSVMRIRPGLLFWGLFFILLGGLPLLVRSGALDPDAFAGAWRLWPLLLVALGVSVILGRSRAGLLGTVLAATVLGIAAGGALASGSTWIGDVGGCGALGSGTEQRFERGEAVDAPLEARFELDCGSMDISVVPGNQWRVQADHHGQPPTLELSDGSVGLRSPEGLGPRRQDWTITLPADQLRTLDVTSNASTSTVRLAGAELTSMRAQLNAGDLRVDGGDASVQQVDLSINAGRIRYSIDSSTTGSVSANAGSIELCVPADATLTFRVEEQLTFGHNLDDRGLARSGDVWTRQGDVGGPVIDLDVEGNAANLSLDPEDGC